MSRFIDASAPSGRSVYFRWFVHEFRLELVNCSILVSAFGLVFVRSLFHVCFLCSTCCLRCSCSLVDFLPAVFGFLDWFPPVVSPLDLRIFAHCSPALPRKPVIAAPTNICFLWLCSSHSRLIKYHLSTHLNLSCCFWQMRIENWSYTNTEVWSYTVTEVWD